MDNHPSRRPRSHRVAAISEADFEIGMQALNTLKASGISDPMEIVLISADDQRVRDCITSSAFVGVSALLLGRGMEAERAGNIGEAVADSLLDMLWVRQHGKPKPN